MNSNYGIEHDRLTFIIERDGIDGAIKFAKQTYNVYRTSLKQSRKRGHKKPHHATIPEYRLGFVLSCLAFRKFLRETR